MHIVRRQPLPASRPAPADVSAAAPLSASTRLTRILAVLCLITGLITTGCSKDRSSPPQEQVEQQTVSIGVVPERDIFKQVQRYEPLADYLSRQLKLKVTLVAMPSYDTAVEFFRDKQLDAAFFGSMTYIQAHARLGAEAVARPVNLDGTSTYYGVLFVRKDSAIRSVEDMKGKRMVLVDRNTTAGYLLPLAYFKKKGKNYKTYLKEFYYAGTHEDAIYDVLHRKADIGAAKSSVLKRLIEENDNVKGELVILARTPPVPDNCLTVRQGLSAEIKEDITRTLLHMHEEPQRLAVLSGLKMQKFVATADGDFRAVYKFARDLDIDPTRGSEEPHR